MIKNIYRIIIIVSLLLCFSESEAQYYFGRNKVQYNNFTWYILKTEHFDIYFYPEMRELAEIGAAYAEESYTFLEDKFNHNIYQVDMSRRKLLKCHVCNDFF